MANERPRSFSGVQPSGKIHIGNYTGALQPWVETQNEVDGIYCVVDLHALTAPHRGGEKALAERSREVAALYLACGLDPAVSTIFRQSEVWPHPYLSWLLETHVPLGWLSRMTQFKSKTGEANSIPTGLLTYPVLQTADILLYDTNVVPVGEDQTQHIELARDIAQRFNSIYGTVFVVPEAKIATHGSRIMALDDPTVKMSKSGALASQGHSIGIVDTPDQIVRAVRRAVTDSGSTVDIEHAGSGVRNLLNIFQSFSGDSERQLAARFEGKGYGVLKDHVADLLVEALAPIRADYSRILADRGYLERVLATGRDRALQIAVEKIACVVEIFGLRG